MAASSRPVVCFSYLAAASLWNVKRFPQANHGAEVQRAEASIAAVNLGVPTCRRPWRPRSAEVRG
jgi:hypothetical protein